MPDRVPDDLLTPFDAWLWALDGARLSELRLAGLARAAGEDAVRVPQLTVLTVIGEAAPADVLGSATGMREVRRSDHVALLRAQMGRQEYLVAAWPAASGVWHLVGTVSRHRRGLAPDGGHLDERRRSAPVARHPQSRGLRGDRRRAGRARRYGRGPYDRPRPARPFVLHARLAQLEGRRRPTHREALRETEEQNGMIVRTLTLDVGGDLRVHLRRTSGASFYKGDFGIFYDVVLRRLEIAASERLRLLGDRQREPLAPVREVISMRVDRVNLDDPTVRVDILDTLAGVSGLQVAVMHDNPYMHVLVTDFRNGASFDVLVTDGSRLDVLPGLRSSPGTLARVTDALGDALGMRDLVLSPVGELLDDEDLLVS